MQNAEQTHLHAFQLSPCIMSVQHTGGCPAQWRILLITPGRIQYNEDVMGTPGYSGIHRYSEDTMMSVGYH